VRCGFLLYLKFYKLEIQPIYYKVYIAVYIFLQKKRVQLRTLFTKNSFPNFNPEITYIWKKIPKKEKHNKYYNPNYEIFHFLSLLKKHFLSLIKLKKGARPSKRSLYNPFKENLAPSEEGDEKYNKTKKSLNYSHILNTGVSLRLLNKTFPSI